MERGGNDSVEKKEQPTERQSSGECELSARQFKHDKSKERIILWQQLLELRKKLKEKEEIQKYMYKKNGMETFENILAANQNLHTRDLYLTNYNFVFKYIPATCTLHYVC